MKRIIIIIFLLQSISLSKSIDNINMESGSSLDNSQIQFCFIGGPSVVYDELGITGSFELSYNNILYNLSYIQAEEFNIFGPSPSESTEELSILIGKKRNSKYGYLSASAGLSYLQMIRRGSLLSSSGGTFLSTDEYEKKPYHIIGIPLRAEAILKLYYVGIGIQFMLNINTVSPMIGLSPIIYFGTYENPTKSWESKHIQ